MSILRSSKWNYQTGSTGGVSIEFVVASGGCSLRTVVRLIEPAVTVTYTLSGFTSLRAARERYHRAHALVAGGAERRLRARQRLDRHCRRLAVRRICSISRKCSRDRSMS